MLPQAVESLIDEFTKLPGIGRRSAERLAFDLLNNAPDKPREFAAALLAMAERVAPCPTCFFYADAGRCAICASTGRDTRTLCVVETAMDVVAFERTGVMRPMYHVLGGRLVPMRGITPRTLRIDELKARVGGGAFAEVILATSPTVEGEATSLFLARELSALGVRATRIGRGVPMGGSLEHTDAETLRLALESRRSLEP